MRWSWSSSVQRLYSTPKHQALEVAGFGEVDKTPEYVGPPVVAGRKGDLRVVPCPGGEQLPVQCVEPLGAGGGCLGDAGAPWGLRQDGVLVVVGIHSRGTAEVLCGERSTSLFNAVGSLEEWLRDLMDFEWVN